MPLRSVPSLAVPWIVRQNAHICLLNRNTFKKRSCFCIWGHVLPPVSWSVHPVMACKGMGAGEGVRRRKRRLAWPNLLQGCLPSVITLARNYRILHQCCLLLGRLRYTLSRPTAAFQVQYQHLLRLYPHWVLFLKPNFNSQNIPQECKPCLFFFFFLQEMGKKSKNER